MNRKASKAIRVITTLLILALLLLPMAALVACRGAPPLTVEDIKDVSPDDWFYRYVVAGIRFGVIRDERGGGGGDESGADGESDKPIRFEPDKDITLGEFITMLGRLHEHGNRRAMNRLGDGPDCERYMKWATESGITLDHPDWADLTPDTLLNREYKAAIVMSYILAYDLDDYFQLRDYNHHVMMLPFWDHEEMAPWSQGATMRLNTMRIMSGKYRMYFMPHDPVSRAEALQVLIRVGSALYDSIHPLMLQ